MTNFLIVLIAAINFLIAHYCYYYYIHLTAFFQDNLGKLAPER